MSTVGDAQPQRQCRERGSHEEHGFYMVPWITGAVIQLDVNLSTGFGVHYCVGSVGTGYSSVKDSISGNLLDIFPLGYYMARPHAALQTDAVTSSDTCFATCYWNSSVLLFEAFPTRFVVNCFAFITIQVLLQVSYSF